MHPPRGAAGWQCPAQPYRPSLSSLDGSTWKGGQWEQWGLLLVVRRELDDEIEGGGEVGNEVGDRVVRPQETIPLREGRMGGGRRSP